MVMPCGVLQERDGQCTCVLPRRPVVSRVAEPSDVSFSLMVDGISRGNIAGGRDAALPAASCSSWHCECRQANVSGSRSSGSNFVLPRAEGGPGLL